VYIANYNAETIDLNVKLSMQGEPLESITVSLFDNDALLAKNAVSIKDNAEATFTIPSTLTINGKLIIEDSGLQYDNSFYFNINTKSKIKVLAINEGVDNNFLERIYTRDEFDYKSYKISDLNFNLIPDLNLIALNELESISSALKVALTTFKKDGGSILIIPSDKVLLSTYNQTFKDLSLFPFIELNDRQKRITSINYNHPLLKNAFYSKVSNFQYPKVESSYILNSNNNAVLSYEDGSAFLIGNGNVYVFSSALNSNNSNFKNSPLIVPVLYNIGKQSLKLPQLFYTIGQPNSIAVDITLGQDDILTLTSDETSVIPLQKTYSKSVILETEEYPERAGILEVKNKAEVLQRLSFNYDRDESNLMYFDIANNANYKSSDSLTLTINDIKSSTTINALWKWFVIFALVFLIIEILLLKYLK
jgi:hypothetical protein